MECFESVRIREEQTALLELEASSCDLCALGGISTAHDATGLRQHNGSATLQRCRHRRANTKDMIQRDGNKNDIPLTSCPTLCDFAHVITDSIKMTRHGEERAKHRDTHRETHRKKPRNRETHALWGVDLHTSTHITRKTCVSLVHMHTHTLRGHLCGNFRRMFGSCDSVQNGCSSQFASDHQSLPWSS